MARRRVRVKRQPREIRLVSEFMATEFPNAITMTQVRLGSMPAALTDPSLTPQERNMVGNWRRWANGVVIEPGTITVIEASIRPQAGKLSQLELYMSLVPHTPEFEEYKPYIVKGMVLFAVIDPVVVTLARARGFEVREHRPKWVVEYLSQLSPRHRIAPVE